MNIVIKELQILQRYLYNKMNYDSFKEAMKPISTNDGYITEKFETFKRDSLSFIVNYKEVFHYCIDQINKTNYKG